MDVPAGRSLPLVLAGVVEVIAERGERESMGGFVVKEAIEWSWCWCWCLCVGVGV